MNLPRNGPGAETAACAWGAVPAIARDAVVPNVRSMNFRRVQKSILVNPRLISLRKISVEWEVEPETTYKLPNSDEMHYFL